MRPVGNFGPLLVVPDAVAAEWELVARPRSGSLRDAVAALRRRNLALSFGVLLALAASIAMIMIWTQRAQRLAKLQMDFVAGVSHELRTPVSVICSAVENLADGIVDTRPQVKKYGALIRNEGRRLSEMVGQILLFAAARERRPQYDFRSVEISQVIESALADLAPLIEAGGFMVEKQITPDLPPATADPVALSQCLRNLMTNALQYGVRGRWVAILAHANSGTAAGEIQIAVQDRGPGIGAEDLPHVFQPFYRGSAARASQVRGTGLGLSLAKEIAEAMGGKLTATSSIGEGSSFTLHLPVAKQGNPRSANIA